MPLFACHLCPRLTTRFYPAVPNPPYTLPPIASRRQGYADALAKAEATGLPQYHIQVRMKTVLPRIQPATERDLLAIRRQVGMGMRSHGFGPFSLSFGHTLGCHNTAVVLTYPLHSQHAHLSLSLSLSLSLLTFAPVSWTRTSTPCCPWPRPTSSSTTPPRCTSATRWATT